MCVVLCFRQDVLYVIYFGIDFGMFEVKVLFIDF